MSLGKNATIKITSSSALTAVTALDWAGMTWALEETTPHDANAYTTRNQTVRTDGPITFTLNPFNPSDTDHAALRTANINGSNVEITLTMPNGDTYDGTTAVTKFKPVTPATGNLAMQVEITPLDQMAFTAA